MSSTLIRRATPADAAALAKFMAECFLAAYHHASDPERIAGYVGSQFSSERLQADLQDAQLLTWILEVDDQWAGFAQLHLSVQAPGCVSGYQHPLELRRYYFAPRFHGAGLAGQMMQVAKQSAQEHGADALWLNVWQHAPQAIRFYSKHGFEIVGTAIFWIMDDPKDDWVMCCRV